MVTSRVSFKASLDHVRCPVLPGLHDVPALGQTFVMYTPQLKLYTSSCAGTAEPVQDSKFVDTLVRGRARAAS